MREWRNVTITTTTPKASTHSDHPLLATKPRKLTSAIDEAKVQSKGKRHRSDKEMYEPYTSRLWRSGQSCGEYVLVEGWQSMFPPMKALDTNPLVPEEESYRVRNPKT
jgi:hypothetical protein